MSWHRKGKVSLVGAGPGDLGLMTLKGWDRLRSADLIVYDHLVNPDLLRSSHPHAKLVFAGKGGSSSATGQARINRLLVREAKKGLKVLRLKGGDPYLFGRGAEEGSYLRKSGIDFEVVPGITSAAGCSAYAGVPLTERHLGSSVAFITGHSAHAPGREKGIQWKALLQAVDTIVVYMGVSEIHHIRQELLNHGCSPDKPVALIEWGTRPHQKSVFGKLHELPRMLRRRKISSPALMIIGEVVRLNKVLNWFESLPLFGKRIVVTRARNQQASFKAGLEDLGATVFELPTISIAAPKNCEALDHSIQNIYQYDWLLFTSTNAVDHFFNRLIHHFGKDARTLSQTKIGVVGQSTRDRLKSFGVVCDFMPSRFTTRDLVSELRKHHGVLRDQRFLLPRTHIAPKELEEELKRLGASVTSVVAYETHFPKAEILKSIALIKKEGFDAITFTSSSTVTHLCEAIGKARFRQLLSRASAVSIGPVTSQTLKRFGIRIAREASVSTLDGMMDVLKEL